MEAGQAYRLYHPKSLDSVCCAQGFSKLFFSFFNAPAHFFVGRFKPVEFVNPG